ncbi:MAG: ZIP family metal transporter [Janthinobacterium lividum]
MEAGFAVGIIQAVAVLSAVWLSGRRRWLETGMPYLVSLAVGVLLGTALLHILPEAVTSLGNRQSLWLTFTATIFFLFCIERISSALLGQEASGIGGHHVDLRHHGVRPLSLVVGGVLHSFVDGVSVAAAFTAGRRVGWVTAAAITLHEVPHRMGDYALLTHLRVKKPLAMQLIVWMGVAALTGVFLVATVGHAFGAADWLLPISAASFVYIALVSLMPELMGAQGLRTALLQLTCMLLGGVLVILLLRLPVS